MFSDILLATGGEEASNRAADHAIELAAHHDATLHVLDLVVMGTRRRPDE